MRPILLSQAGGNARMLPPAPPLRRQQERPTRPTWTPEEWERIERIARAERKHRGLMKWPLRPMPLRVHRAVADGAALELRQWAGVATGAAARVEDPLLTRLVEDYT